MPRRYASRREGGSMQHWRLLTSTVIASLLVGCGGGGDGSYNAGPSTGPTTNPGGPTGVSTNNVVIADQAFNPGAVNVPVGTTVTWEWKSCVDDPYGTGYGGCVSHNVTFDDGSSIASSTQSTGTFSRTFNAAGTYKYHCTVHGASAMSGQVTVK
jgi:plastocyanin